MRPDEHRAAYGVGHGHDGVFAELAVVTRLPGGPKRCNARTQNPWMDITVTALAEHPDDPARPAPSA